MCLENWWRMVVYIDVWNISFGCDVYLLIILCSKISSRCTLLYSTPKKGANGMTMYLLRKNV